MNIGREIKVSVMIFVKQDIHMKISDYVWRRITGSLGGDAIKLTSNPVKESINSRLWT